MFDQDLAFHMWNWSDFHMFKLVPGETSEILQHSWNTYITQTKEVYVLFFFLHHLRKEKATAELISSRSYRYHRIVFFNNSTERYLLRLRGVLIELLDGGRHCWCAAGHRCVKKHHPALFVLMCWTRKAATNDYSHCRLFSHFKWPRSEVASSYLCVH